MFSGCFCNVKPKNVVSLRRNGHPHKTKLRPPLKVREWRASKNAVFDFMVCFLHFWPTLLRAPYYLWMIHIICGERLAASFLCVACVHLHWNSVCAGGRHLFLGMTAHFAQHTWCAARWKAAWKGTNRNVPQAKTTSPWYFCFEVLVAQVPLRLSRGRG